MDVKHSILEFIHNEVLDPQDGNRLEDSSELIEAGILDSLGMMKLLTFIEESFSVTLDESALVPENFESVATLSCLVEKSMSL